nr:MAG TPA: hypothetical protein [Caudoviricetes sp.]
MLQKRDFQDSSPKISGFNLRALKMNKGKFLYVKKT